MCMNKKVFVYFNLHKKIFSIREVSSGLVIAHARTVKLRNAFPKVSERGRQRVLEERVKNVHAGIQGYLEEYSDEIPEVRERGIHLHYNPYLFSEFVVKDSKEPFEGVCDFVMYSDTRDVIALVKGS